MTVHNDLDVINSQINLVQWAETAGARLHKAGREFRGNCPLHGGDNQQGFAIYDDERRWTCFTGDCGSGDALGFIMKFKRVGLLEAIEIATGGKPISPEDVVRIQAEQAERAARQLEEQIKHAQTVLAEIRETQVWLKYHEQLEQSEVGRNWWSTRGVPVTFQNYWQLGYETDRRVWIGDEIRVPTATIPIFAQDWQCQQVKHRLIGAPDKAGKYRYEYTDLPAQPFLSDPDEMKAKTVVLVEGEIKAMVTAITLDTPNWQVVGMPGKGTPIDRVTPYLSEAQDVFVCCDPDTGKLNEDIAHELGAGRCRIVETPIKIDDYILAADIGKDKLKTLFNQSRRVK